VSHLALQPPGVRVESVRPAPEPSPLRSDIAGFVGPTRRGPIGAPARVEGWRGYQRLFGGLDVLHDTTYAVRGYFENGGEVAWVVRLAPEGLDTAQVIWRPAGLWGMPAEIRFTASSPGAWAAGVDVALGFRREGLRGRPEIDLFVREPGEPSEALLGLDAWTLSAELAARSIRLRCDPFPEPAPSPPSGPRAADAALTLALPPGSLAPPIGAAHYLAGLDKLVDQPEVAILALPQLLELEETEGRRAVVDVVHSALVQAEELRDRIALVDVPLSASARAGAVSLPDSIERWLEEDLGRSPASADAIPWRAGACYFPWVRVDDPLDPARPLRSIPPSGHVAGIISLLDRERGAHHTPALEPMIGVFDLEEEASRDDHAALNQLGVNLLRCVPGRGFAVFGGRTLDLRREQRFLAHRRFIHRLVRAFRQVAEPLVFETNGPGLWLQLVRAVTAVLLEAWRSGALKGNRADEAFRVQCDAESNAPEEIERGRCLCLVELAPAAPMEFILLRLALARDGSLEVLP
jgi:uncharacterized protein